MTARAGLDKQPAMEIPSLILPMSEHLLLAPTVSIAEIVSYSRPQRSGDAPDWLVGSIEWRKQTVPLLSLEILRGEEIGDITPRSRIAIFNNTGVSEELPFFGIITQGIPRLSRVQEVVIQEVEGAALKPFEKMRVELEGELCSLPDVAAMEQVLLDYNRNMQS